MRYCVRRRDRLESPACKGAGAIPGALTGARNRALSVVCARFIFRCAPKLACQTPVTSAGLASAISPSAPDISSIRFMFSSSLSK